MKISLQYMDQLQGISDWQQAKGFVRQQFEDLASQIAVGWNTNHLADGTHNFAAINAGRFLTTAQDVLANAPNGLGPEEQGLLYYVTDYGHLVRWTGTVWAFAPGDVGNGFFRDYAITPQEVGWAMCDGSTVSYLVVGGVTLTSANIVLPNLSGSPAYRKSAAAYTGTIIAAGGSVANESAHTHSHDHTLPNTDNESAHFHSLSTTLNTAALGAGASPYVQSIDNGGNTQAGSAHHHTFSSNTGSDATAGSAHAHTVGTIDVAHLNVLPYFRR